MAKLQRVSGAGLHFQEGNQRKFEENPAEVTLRLFESSRVSGRKFQTRIKPRTTDDLRSFLVFGRTLKFGPISVNKSTARSTFLLVKSVN